MIRLVGLDARREDRRELEQDGSMEGRSVGSTDAAIFVGRTMGFFKGTVNRVRRAIMKIATR